MESTTRRINRRLSWLPLPDDRWPSDDWRVGIPPETTGADVVHELEKLRTELDALTDCFRAGREAVLANCWRPDGDRSARSAAADR